MTCSIITPLNLGNNVSGHIKCRFVNSMRINVKKKEKHVSIEERLADVLKRYCQFVIRMGTNVKKNR